ncbi:MAG: GntR family transcriptional regulator [Clostridium sp.]|uniref:GntR family transcriptional regulator n=1 Tax=Clostridium sp. TaxID=1506 RepID=UPI001EBC845D|nr:GntR family transcriptional regulator [Clostridium sp.]MBS5884626.1 GntR family transcriptional regulator [Clostridium sp.]MDU7148939.1 GntR family transcriptional regulator [Clostridium sp.]MDU7242466.1 GntR family transcriptional regulator [Clostridium sp.]
MKYVEVYEEIKNKIIRKEYSSWSSLEGEEILCHKYAVSRPTLRKAILKLKNEGYVHSRQGSGIFVNPPEFYEQSKLTTLSEKQDEGYKIENKIFFCKEIEADENLCNVFNVDKKEKFIYFKRLRVVSGEPKILEYTYMPCYLFKDFNEEVLNKSVFKYMEERYNVSHDIKTIKAIKSNEDISKVLEIDLDSAILEIEHKVYLTKSILAQYTKEISTDNSITIASVR